MWLDILKFYRECLARAFSGKFFLIEKWTGGIGLLAVLATKFLPIPARWQPMVENDLPLYFFITVFLVVVFAGFVSAPVTIYKEERERRFRLEIAREPKFKVYIKSPEGTREYSGVTFQTHGGNRQTTLNGLTSNGLSLVVENHGERRIDKCTAALLWAECVEGEKTGLLNIVEPIFLPWSPENPEENLEASIEPNTLRRVWIADVNYRGWAWIIRDTRKLPADNQQIFGPPGRYRALIQISDGETLSIQTKIEFEAGQSEPTKHFPSGTGKASIAILEQDSSRLWPSNTAEETPPKTRHG